MLQLSQEELQLLLETAFMAIGHNHFTSAMKILMALEQFRPGHESLDCAKAFLCLSQYQGQVALDFLEKEALPRHPESRQLKVFKAMAFMQTNRVSEAKFLLEELQSGNDNVADMAAGLLQNLQNSH